VKANQIETLPLKDRFKETLEEARVILPGIQALFGFQFVAVFNNGFAKLEASDQRLHIVALFLTALSVVSSMAPAALHRQAQPDQVSERLVKISTCLLTFGMAPLAIAIALDFYIVSNVVLHDVGVSKLLAMALGLLLILTWFIFPWSVKRHLNEGGR